MSNPDRLASEAAVGARVLAVLPGIDAGAGAEQSFAATAAAIVASGIDLHLAVLTHRHGLVGEVEAAGVTVHTRVPRSATDSAVPTASSPSGFRAGGSLIERTRWLGSLIDELQPDVVHATLFEAQMPAQLDRIGRRARFWRGTNPPPLIVTWASTLYGPERAVEMGSSAWKLRVLRWIEIAVARASGTIFHAVTPGTGSVNASRLAVPASRVRVVERGRPDPTQRRAADAAEQIRRSLCVDPAVVAAIDLRDSNNSDRGEDGRGSEARGVLVVALGRHERAKGYDRLLDAAMALLPMRPNLVVAIAGRDGGDSPRLRAHPVFDSFGDRCVLLGHRADVADLLAAADIVACTSLREGAAGSLIEAMSAGRAICSVELPSLDGILIDGQNSATASPDRFAERLAVLVDDRVLRDRLGAAGRTTYEERFTVEASAARMAEMYRAVTQNARSDR